MGQMAVCPPMAAFRGAPSIAALRERFLADTSTEPADYEARYGRDVPRFLDTGPYTMRPTSRHLLAPLWRDTEGREYTPDDVDADGRCAVWWVRIPPGLTRRQRAAGSYELTEFPQPGERLTWHRVGTAGETVRVVVADLILPKTASAQLILAAPAPAQRTDAELERLSRREQSRERRRPQH